MHEFILRKEIKEIAADIRSVVRRSIRAAEQIHEAKRKELEGILVQA